MMYRRETPDSEIILELLNKSGMSVRQFSKLMYGENTHRDLIKDIQAKPDIRSSTLVKICNILEISMDLLFNKIENTDPNNEIPSIVGNYNVINSQNVNNNLNSLRAENRALKLLIQEKNLRIEDLRLTNKNLSNQVDYLLSKIRTDNGHK